MADPAYIRNHKRVRRVRGRAAEHVCVDCGEKQAKDWSQVHGTTGESVDDFEPRCKRCHLIYDGAMEGVRRANIGNRRHAGHWHTEEAKASISAKMTGMWKGKTWIIDPLTGKRVWKDRDGPTSLI